MKFLMKIIKISKNIQLDVASRGGRLAGHSPHHPKVKGLIPGALNELFIYFVLVFILRI
jgi:hypothetical protein